MHAGKDDPDVGAADQGITLGYTCGGIGKTVAWILIVGLEGAEGWRDCDDPRNDRVQRRDRGVQGLYVHFVGRQRSEPVPPSEASLLPGHERSDVCCRQ